jgi:hypothetical protein
MALMKPYVYIDDRPGGTGHGTPYDYDRHVPLFFMGHNVTPGRYPDACGPEDIAPTLGRLLGFDYPREYDSRLLTELLPPHLQNQQQAPANQGFSHEVGKGYAPPSERPAKPPAAPPAVPPAAQSK